MPNKKSADKRLRRDKSVRITNRSKIREMKTSVKKCDVSVGFLDLQDKVKDAQKLLDRCSRLRLISKQRAGRIVSKLMTRLASQA